MGKINGSHQACHQVIWHCLPHSRKRLFSKEAHGYPNIGISGGKRRLWIHGHLCLTHAHNPFLAMTRPHRVEAVGPRKSCRIILWRPWEVCLPHSCFLLVGDDQRLFVWGHPGLVDEAGPKVVAGEGEMDSRAHGTARDGACKCWTVAYLQGGKGRWSMIRRSGRKGPFSPQVKDGGSLEF